MNPPATPASLDWLAAHLLAATGMVRTSVTNWLVSTLRPPPVALGTHLYLARAFARIERLIAKAKARGFAPVEQRTPRPYRPTGAEPDEAAPNAPSPPQRAAYDTHRHGWLLDAMKIHHAPGPRYELTEFAVPRLQGVVNYPDLPALIAAAPGLARQFRPLCRMLGVALPACLVPSAPPPPRRLTLICAVMYRSGVQTRKKDRCRAKEPEDVRANRMRNSKIVNARLPRDFDTASITTLPRYWWMQYLEPA